MAEIGLIALSAVIMSRYRRAGEQGGGRYVWGIWLTWLAAVIVASVAGVQTGSEGAIYGLILVGYVICFVIAANGMRSGRQYLDNYEAMKQREREKEQEKQIERQVQTRVDAAVAAALAQYQRRQAASESSSADAPAPAAISDAHTETQSLAEPAAFDTPVPAQSMTASTPEGKFYVFAAQGPAFGAGFTGDVAMEKAMKLKADYPLARTMDLVLVRPGEWSAPISASSAGSIISASFSLDDHRGDIEKHLLQLGVPSGKIEEGLRESKVYSLQLMNPMSGLFVMGIPIA